jgi:hypothetical protein
MKLLSMRFTKIRRFWLLVVLILFSLKTILPLEAQQIRQSVPINIIGDRVFLLKGYPDSLAMNGFTIVVEEYDKGGRYDPATKTYLGLSGIGRIRFGCMPPNFYVEKVSNVKDAILRPYSVKVVDSIRNPQTEISLSDAEFMGIKTKTNTSIEIMLPHIGSTAVDLSRFLNDYAAPFRRLDGIRVRFTNLSVVVANAGATKGTVTEGVAKYPSENALPSAPVTLNVADGFQLELDSFYLRPFSRLFFQQPVTAWGRLLLPKSLTSGSDCQAASLSLGSFALSANCEFYKELTDSTYGKFGIGVTTLNVGGRGYIVDFSSTRLYAPSSKPAAWKGVMLLNGKSTGAPSGTVTSNIGYLQNEYSFSQAFVESTGFAATMNSVVPYQYQTAQPLGYTLILNTSQIVLTNSKVRSGFLQSGRISLPRTAVRQVNDATVVLDPLNLTIDSLMGLEGYATLPNDLSLYWGDLIGAGGGEQKSFGVHNLSQRAVIRFLAQPRPAYYPLSTDGKTFEQPNEFNSAIANFQGALFLNPSILVVNSPDVNMPPNWQPNDPVQPFGNGSIFFQLKSAEMMWLNVVTEGVHCHLQSTIWESPKMALGDLDNPLYVGKEPFNVSTNYANAKTKQNERGSILLQCVESAVFTCDFRSFINIPKPVNSTFGFKEMVFTSTANNAGGKLLLGAAQDSLDYWGLKLVQKPGFTNAGLVSVKTGQIIITAAGLSESRHFAQPFWLTWGEILANGNMGRLFFDFNAAGQQFDKFNFVHNAVALSPYVPSEKAYLRVGGTAYLPFFGGDYLHIQDLYDPSAMAAPFVGRIIKLSDDNSPIGFFPTDRSIYGNWSDGLGVFNFTLNYADAAQDGFVGTGTSLLRSLTGGAVGSSLELNSRGACMRIGSDLNDQRGVSLGPVANITNISRLWGCACIVGDGIANVVVGGEVTNAANLSVAARVGSHLSAVMQLTPSLTKVTFDGEAYLSLALSLDVVVNGHMQLLMNHAEGFLEGEVQGKIRAVQGALFVGSSVEAEGQANWHIGVDFHELQGMLAVRVMGMGVGTDLGAAFYLGKNAPKSRAWVLIGRDPRYSLNMTAMPNNLTGIYGAFTIKQSINLYIISGGYEVHVGFGAFLLTPDQGSALGGLTPAIGLPYIVGNLGGRIHGEILGGLVSAGAYFNMQVIGPYPFGFQGTIGLEACALWVFCGSVDVTIGLNSANGFYIQ